MWGMEDGIRTQPTPLVRDGIMFLPNWGTVVQALDAATGTLLWEYRRKFGPDGPIGRGRSRTIALWEDLVIVATADAHMIALDARTGVLRWEVFTHGGRRPTGMDAVDWGRRMQAAGAGEILLTSMDRDGTKRGFDLELTRAFSDALDIPVIASG